MGQRVGHGGDRPGSRGKQSERPFAEDGGVGRVTTGDLTVFADPRNRRQALSLREPELIQIQLLPRGDAG